MSEALERAHETMEHHHEHVPHIDPWSRRVAVLVSVLAAALAITEIAGKQSENEYLTRHIAVSDDYAFYQAKYLRALIREAEADMLGAQPNAQDPAIQARIKAATDFAARQRDDPNGQGVKQLLEKAKGQEHERDHAWHRYHAFEYASGALQIAIVLASVSVVTRIRTLTIVSGIIGCLAGIAAALIQFGMV